MRRFLQRFLTSLGAAVLLAVLAGLTVRAFRAGYVPEHTVLELDLDERLVEWAPDDPVARVLLGRGVRLRDVLDALERGAADARVGALVVRLGGATAGLAQYQELREAVLAFRRSGKRATAFAETFGEGGPANGAYYLATAFDEVWLQPSGEVGFTGLLVETPFLRGTLDKLGIEPRLDHRKEFKTAMNLFTEREYTAAHREAAERIAQSQYGQIVRGIAEARGLDEATVRALGDRGPLGAADALAARLVDRLGYRDEVWTAVEGVVGVDAEPMLVDRYVATAGRPNDRGAVIALVHAVGAVQRGRSSIDPLGGDVGMGSDSVARALREAAEDDAVRAIVLRVDSPGGSYVASDVIWRAVTQARAAGKPVVVSMGDVAGSGGYFIAMNADRIVAHPGTLTGSIGVVAGKMLLRGLYEKLGISWDAVATGEHADMWSQVQDFSPSEWANFQTMLDRIYADFTGKVAAGRRLAPERVAEIAKGRVWTGEDAKGIGLVDELGGYPTALRLAREVAGLSPDAAIELRPYPSRKNLLAAVIARLRGEDEDEEPVRAALTALQARLRPAVALLRAAGLGAADGALVMPFAASPVR